MPAGGCPDGPPDAGSVAICLATGAGTYATLTISTNNLAFYASQPGNIVPMPSGGCPTTSATTTLTTLTICVATGSASTPYATLVINASDVAFYAAQPGNIIPRPVGGCPSGSDATTSTMLICLATGSAAAPYIQVMINSNDVGQYAGYGNIIPVPASGCPGGQTVTVGLSTLTICQATGSPAAPYREITINASDLANYLGQGNIIVMPVGGCPTVTTSYLSTTVPICVANGSTYIALTVPQSSVNAYVNGSNLVPMPMTGCPVAILTPSVVAPAPAGPPAIVPAAPVGAPPTGSVSGNQTFPTPAQTGNAGLATHTSSEWPAIAGLIMLGAALAGARVMTRKRGAAD